MKASLTLLGLMVTGAWALAQEPADSPRAADLQLDSRAIDAFVGDYLQHWQVPAAAVAIRRSDGTRYARGFGQSNGQQVTPSDPFFIGSVTKTMTGLAMLRLVDQGVVGLDTPVYQVLPDFSMLPEADARRITVRNLLEHRSGIATKSAFDPVAQRTGEVQHLTLAGPPGGEVRYSSLNFLILGQLLEALGEAPYAEVMEREVFEPLGMTSTSAAVGAQELVVQGHTYFFGFPVARSEPEYLPPMIPAGYAVTSADDLSQYVGAVLDALVGADTTYLTNDIVQTTFSEMLDRGGVAGGWGSTRRLGHRGLSHKGMTPSFYAAAVVIPELDVALAFSFARNSGPFSDAADPFIDGLLGTMMGDAPPPAPRWEKWIDTVFLFMAIQLIVRCVLTSRSWLRAGSPWRLAPTLGSMGRFVADAVGTLVIAYVVLNVFAKISLAGLIEFYPDLGWLLVASVVVGIPRAYLHAAVRARQTAT